MRDTIPKAQMTYNWEV